MSRFEYIKPDEKIAIKLKEIQKGFETLESLIQEQYGTLPCRELSLVWTKLEEACMWAKKGIAHKTQISPAIQNSSFVA